MPGLHYHVFDCLCMSICIFKACLCKYAIQIIHIRDQKHVYGVYWSLFVYSMLFTVIEKNVYNIEMSYYIRYQSMQWTVYT